MVSTRSPQRRVGVGLVVALLAGLVSLAGPTAPAGAFATSSYRVVNLASDVPGMALVQDPLMANPWGMASAAGTPMYLANDGSATVERYRVGAAGRMVRHNSLTRYTVPGGLPTGIVYNTGSDFDITSGTKTQPAHAITASITGNLVGWHESVNAGSGVLTVNKPGHVYTGLAIGSNSGGNRLYAADFANGTIDVFTGSYASTTTSGNFADPTIPTTSGNTFHPFNIQKIGSSLYVLYAKVGNDGLQEDGVGNGFVRRFNMDGVRDLTFGINNGPLNSPWGIALAPASYGIFGSALIIGNRGDGNPNLHAFNPTTGAFLGTLQDDDGSGIVIPRLTGLSFGNGAAAGSTTSLYFTAGTSDDLHGVYGAITSAPAVATSAVEFSSDQYNTTEASTGLQITVTRSGDVSAPASVQYAAWDQGLPHHAIQKNDYQIQTGLVTFAAGQTSSSFTMRPGEDKFVEGAEIVDLALSNPVGTNLGDISRAAMTIADNDVSPSSLNPLDDPTFFVYRQYLDFFNRVPDPGGAAYWKNRFTACNGASSCIASTRVEVSAKFFLSNEFQNGVSLAYRVRKAATGKAPLYGELMTDGTIRRLLGNAGYLDNFVKGSEFDTYVDSLGNTAYVDTLIANSGGTFTSAQRNALLNGLNGATKTRAQVLGEVAENTSVKNANFRPSFVFMQYAGYLRRDPDTAGYTYWLNRLNTFDGDYVRAGMVKNFITTAEYRHRFGAN
jgi:uncharacterized protein (TIGR03118 family)